MNKDKIIEVMAKAIYDGSEGLRPMWESPRNLLSMCDVYYEAAEAAFQALLKQLPEMTYRTGQRRGLTDEYEAIADGTQLYQELLNMRDKT